MRHFISASASAVALATALLAGHQASLAAPTDCLAAPNGAAPKGQHWYYHLDHASQRKCWYVRDLGAAAAAAPSQQADSAAPAAIVTKQPAGATGPEAAASARPAERAMSAPLASGPWPQSSRPAAGAATASGVDEVSTPPSPAKPGDARAAAPLQPAPAANAASVSNDPSPVVANSVQNATAAPDAQNAAAEPPSVVADPSVRRAPAKKRTAALRETPAAAPAAATEPATSVGQNVLIVLLAALLAGAVFAVFAVFRRRKPVTFKPAAGGPRFGSRPERDDGLSLKWPRREAGIKPAAPIQNSLIPQQVSVTRRSAPRR